jgi:glycogen operon protein
MLAQGVPMIAHGDEVNRTQKRNNNAYAQDNEMAWMDWEQTEADEALFEFTRKMIELRKAEPLLRRRRYFRGQPDEPNALKDVAWLRPDGSEMGHDDWAEPIEEPLIFRLSGTAFDEADEFGGEIRTSSLFIAMNPSEENVEVTLPEPNLECDHGAWQMVISTASADGETEVEAFDQGSTLTVPGRTIVVLRGVDA